MFLANVASLAPAPAAEQQDEIRRLDTQIYKTSPHSALITSAEAAGIATSGFELREGEVAPCVGDSVAALVTLLEPGQTRQWIVGLSIGEVDVVEERPPDPVTLYSTSGSEIRFESANAAVDALTLGPVDIREQPGNGPPVPMVDARAVVNREFLALGFERACRTIIRLKKAREDGRIGKDERFGFSGQPYEPDEIAAGRDIATRAELTFDDERAFAATFPALMTYVHLVTQTKGLSEILEAVVQRPSIWSLIWRFGRVTWNLRFESASVMELDPLEVGLPAGPSVHQLPFTLILNDQPALECILVVAPPDPPLLTSAGIVGMTARRPGSDERRLVIRLLSAKRASPASD